MSSSVRSAIFFVPWDVLSRMSFMLSLMSPGLSHYLQYYYRVPLINSLSFSESIHKTAITDPSAKLYLAVPEPLFIDWLSVGTESPHIFRSFDSLHSGLITLHIGDCHITQKYLQNIFKNYEKQKTPNVSQVITYEIAYQPSGYFGSKV